MSTISTGANIISYARSGDFRLEAVAASRMLLDRCGAEGAAPIQPQDAAGSLCLPVTDDRSAAAMSRLRQVAIASAYVGFGAVVLAVSLFGWAVATEMPELVVISLVLCIAGLVVQFTDLYWRIAMIRSAILARVRGSGTPSGDHRAPTACVSLEDASTFLRPKPIGEDVGLLWCDQDHRCVLIEGLNYRYFVRAEDVIRVRVRRVPAMCSTEIRFRVGATELAIVLSEYAANPVEFLQLLLSLRSRLSRRIVGTIGRGGTRPTMQVAVP